ncbi:hypothetical protein JD844_027667 [Phrynosoma platyrhinos]|uniref:LRRK2 ARM repeat domain-containing protein n=1 Tax=Phrynosoma platyrhinos TaxID=52577 RepID=A0ABQ7SGM3_PHRPL|nr:hypothetical protein JD844_027667 [Phrynosoma platyrhinos]
MTPSSPPSDPSVERRGKGKRESKAGGEGETEREEEAASSFPGLSEGAASVSLLGLGKTGNGLPPSLANLGSLSGPATRAMASDKGGHNMEQEEEEEEERREAALKKLIVRLKNVQEGKQIETLVQILQDLLSLASWQSGPKLFRGKNLHLPLLLVLVSYMRVASVQQVGWSLLCKLIEICPDTLQRLAAPQGIGKDWDVLGVHQ